MDNLTQEKSKDEIKENGAPEGKSENPIVIEVLSRHTSTE